MEPIYNNIGQTDTTSLRASLQKSVLAFITQHADVFEALSRTQTPFGGSFLVTNR
ncbi:hypothetical protein [Spirosoma linguale]|uniref:Uncharacterized protein n=1 Tax=Spirosoma linguale (strain ATCC 33905 / DSM 74 / LMG 10896 / Claus 1) TaxID=504472 RepID=D2QU40_SPILD|nr:hypothetical protein Slin_6363 [Spirosoma linguale DSM 74]